jgi:ribosome-binding protein aMBF1 (putative translation factor)
MSDLKKYIQGRSRRDAEFKEGFDAGYEQFKIGILLRQARESAGLTQDELAHRMRTKKSAISRIENHAENIGIATLGRYAEALGKQLFIAVR